MESTVSFQNRFLVGVVLLHLFLVVLGSLDIQLNLPGVLGKSLEHYNRISGAGFGYVFFSPGLFKQPVVRFEVVDKNGITHIERLTSGASNEADIRFRSVIDQFTSPNFENADPKVKLEMKRSLAASLARIFFRRYPQAKEVTVHLEDYEFISLPAYNAGERPKATPLYQAKFSLSPIQSKL